MLSPLTKRLVETLQALPGVGPKTAQRLAFQLLAAKGREKGLALAGALQQAMQHVQECHRCRLYTEEEVCAICRNPQRERNLLCIVENAADVFAIQQISSYRGLYYILQGHLSPWTALARRKLAFRRYWIGCGMSRCRVILARIRPWKARRPLTTLPATSIPHIFVTRALRTVYPLAASWNIWMAAPLVMLSVHARFWKFNLQMRNNYAGKLNSGSLMKGAQKMQEIIEKNQEELANTEIVGESGAGLVKFTITGLYVVKSLHLADELLTEPKEVIEELIAAAMTNATQKVTKITQNKMNDMTQLFGGLGDDKTD